jgi:hypothetical protein
MLREAKERDIKKRVRTGAKNLENGTPPLRAKAQSCLDAAARQASPAAARVIIRTVDITITAGTLLVAV